VYTYLKRRASALGQPALSVVWIPAEDRIVWRYVRDVLEGRYSSASAAAPDCRCELVRVFRSRRRANRRRAGRIPRTLDAVAGRIARLACTLGLPRMATPYDAFEHHTLLKHARAVVTGAHKAPLPAARAAYATLMRYYQRRLRRSPIRLRTLAGRPFDAIHGSINALARDLGYRGRDNRRWKPEERRIAAKWLARYRYYLRSDTAWSIPETAISLQQDLTARGFRRTITACKAELYLEKLGRIPARKFRD
jgi:hypothetical protein